MKPHIKISHMHNGMWFCYSPYVFAYGDTPYSAYVNWQCKIRNEKIIARINKVNEKAKEERIKIQRGLIGEIFSYAGKRS